MTPLIETLEGAEVGSVELDCDLSIALGEWAPPVGAERDPKCPDRWRRNGIRYFQPYTEATRSLDAALALVERVLPSVRPGIAKARAPGGRGDMWRANLTEDDGGSMYGAWANTAPLAVCIALLKAHQTKEPTNG